MPATPTTDRRRPVATKPTPRQLSYLRSLAERTGQTFTYPHTVRRGQPRDRPAQGSPARQPRRAAHRAQADIADQLATGPADSARVRDDEISGRGQRRPPGRTTATGARADLGPPGAQAHHPGRRHAHRAGPLHRRRGRTSRVRPARRWRGQDIPWRIDNRQSPHAAGAAIALRSSWVTVSIT